MATKHYTQFPEKGLISAHPSETNDVQEGPLDVNANVRKANLVSVIKAAKIYHIQ